MALELKEIQRRNLELLCLVDDACRKYGIKYSLHGGTLLGAERDGKIIPWDDDTDLSITREEFEKLVRISRDNSLPFAIERSTGAPWVTWLSVNGADGIKTTTDLFIWDYISESKTKQMIKVTLLRFVQGMLKTKINRSDYTKKQLIPVLFSYYFGRLFTLKAKLRIYDSISIRFLTGKKKFIHRSNDSYVGVSYIFDADYMKTYKDINLEGRPFMVNTRYVEFLIRNYGKDYLIPPKEADRKIEHGHNKAFLPESERGGFSIRR